MENDQRFLETVINEYFSPSTSNERKREIEVILDSFTKQGGSWKQALYYLSSSLSSISSSNQYITMFYLNTIEHCIKYRWLTSMNTSEKFDLKNTLYNFLLSTNELSNSQTSTTKILHDSSNNNIYFIKNKIIKLLTDIGKYSWPETYPDFFTSIYQLLDNDRTIIVGLTFFKTISEEWPTIKDEICTDRKIQIKSLLVEEMREIFKVLQRILLTALKQRTAPVAPPSLSNSQDMENRPPIYSHLDNIIVLVLETAAQYCSWIPLGGTIHAPNIRVAQDLKGKVVPITLDFVQLLCQITIANLADNQQCPNQISSLALAVLNELLYRKFIPKEFDEQMSCIVKFSVEVLRKVLDYNDKLQQSPHQQQHILPCLEAQYVEKVIEFLCLGANSHFHRLDENEAKAFMTLLLPFTFKRDEASFYYDCLDIWTRLLDHLNAQVHNIMRFNPSLEEFLNQFTQPLMGLATGIVHSSAKFTCTDEDVYNLDEDEENEVPSISRNIDVLVKIGELRPFESLQSVTSTWADSCRFYVGLQSNLDQSKTVINIENLREVEQFNFVVQLIGRVANIFYGDFYDIYIGPYTSLAKSLFQQLVYLSVISRQYYFVKSPNEIQIATCEIISALKTWMYWFSRYHNEMVLSSDQGEATAENTTEQRSFFEMFFVQVIDNVFYALEHRNNVGHQILSVSAQLFCTVVNCFRIQFLFQQSTVQALIANIHGLRDSLETETYIVLNRAVVSLLLLPWSNNVTNQEWEVRTILYTNYMKKLSTDLLLNTSPPSSSSSISSSRNLIIGLRILNEQLSVLSSEGAVSKKICWKVMKDLVPYLQDLSLAYLRQPNICQKLLTFFLKIMEVVQQQAGASFFEHAITNFLTYFSTQNLINDLIQEHENAIYVVEKFLQMLQYMVKDSSTTFKKYLPETLAICYDHIFPIFQQDMNVTSLKIPFFSLIRDVLNFRWSYFFPANNILQQYQVHQHQQQPFHSTSSNVFASSSSNTRSSPPSNKDEESVVKKRFDQILQSIGQSFLQTDFETFKFNLNSLLSWNEKHYFFTKLYNHHVEIFNEFLIVLLRILVQKSHDLLRDEISNVLYEMVKIDWLYFYKKFLPHFLSTNFVLLSKEHRENLISKFSIIFNNSCSIPTTSASSIINENLGSIPSNFEVDSPTFSMLLWKFIDDLRFFNFIIDCERINESVSQSTTIATG